MSSRMDKWSTFFTVVGWLALVVGVASVVMPITAPIPMIAGALVMLFTAAALDWMDGVLEHLSEIRANQKKIIELMKEK